MKQTLRRSNTMRAAAERMAEAILSRPVLRAAAVCTAYGAGGLVLAGAGVLGAPLPMAVCLIAVSPIGMRALAALVGALLGYGLFWGLYLGLEGMAAALLVFACARIFAPTPYYGRLWFAPAACAAMTAVISGVFTLAVDWSAQAAALLSAKVLLAAVGAVGFRRAVADGDRWAELFLTVCVLMGLGAVPLPGGMTLGAVAAAAASICAAGTAVGAAVAGVCGLAVDLAMGTGGAACTAFLLAGVLCLAFRTPSGLARAALFTVAATAGVLLSAGAPLALIPATALGAALSIPLPGLMLRRRPAAAEPDVSMRTRLSSAADALDTIQTFLQQNAAPARQTDAAVVFDRTADGICRCCGGYERCWEVEATQTYRILSAAAPQILSRGMAVREDFPPEFRCCRLDGFIRTVNSEVDELRLRRMFRAQTELSRKSALDQLSLLASFLRANAQQMERTAVRPDRYRCEIGASAVGRRGPGISGDRCVSVRGPAHKMYVLLCDGMGTGSGAAEESLHAVEVLSSLLRAGAAPEDAIGLLSAALALRGGDGFATVDLFEADLLSGEACLYKQGAAPSYHRRGGRVGQVGSATVPPGLAAGGDCRIGRYSLSLRGEDWLVLVSDGAAGKQTEQRLRDWTGTAPADLAECLIAGCTGEDDATAVAIRLRPYASV